MDQDRLEDDAARGPGLSHDATRERRLLVTIARPTLVITVVGVLVTFVPGVSPAPLHGALTVGALAFLTGISLLLARKGIVRLSSWLFLVGLIYTVTDAFVTYGTFQGANAGGYVVLVTVAGLLRGWRAGVVTAGISIALVAVILVVDQTGLAEVPLLPSTSAASALVTIGIIALSATYLWLALRQRNEALRAASSAAAAAKRSRQRIARLLHESPDGFLSLSVDGRIHDCNDRMAELAGLRRDDLLGESLLALAPFAGGSAERILEAIESAEVAGSGELLEVEIHRGKGQRRFAEAHAKLMDGDGRDPTVLLVVRDVTARWRAHRETEALQSELREAHRLESLGRLAGGIAHDFNNMLLVVLANSELLLHRKDLPEGGRSQLTQIHEAGDRAAALTRQLLAFARRQVLTPNIIDLSGMLREMEAFLTRLMPETVDVEVLLPDRLSPVRVDLSQMEQVLVNLAVNARDAMPRGGRLSIEGKEVDLDAAFCERHAGLSPGKHVKIAVSDDGEGIPAEHLDHVFDPFFTTKGLEGTGLGLSTVYGIIVQTGGSILASSEPGKGSTFTILLPLSPEPLSEPNKRPSKSSAPSRGETVLVVDDEPSVRRIAERVLETAGYRVLVAGGGEEALEVAEKHDGPIELLVTDVVMRGMGGKNLAEALVAERPETRVLFVSGYARNGVDDENAIEEGAFFLAKPFNATTLLEKARAILDGEAG